MNMKLLRVNNYKNFYIFNNSMDNIIEPNKSFDFSKLSLAHPLGIQGGAYFTKIEYNSKPLYIQTVKSITRQEVVSLGIVLNTTTHFLPVLTTCPTCLVNLGIVNS